MGENAHHNICTSLSHPMSLATGDSAFLRRIVRAELAGDRLLFGVDTDDVRARSVSDELARVQPV